MNLTLSNAKHVTAWLKATLMLALLSTIIITTAKAQEDEIFTAVEQSAEFPGGIEAFYKYLQANIRYPDEAKRNGVTGKVFATFVVEKNGDLSNIKILRGIGSGCDEEAVRVLKASPKWNPGKQNGNVVRQQYTVPISFYLPGTEPPTIKRPFVRLQAPAVTDPANPIFSSVEESASFPGGTQAFFNFLAGNIRYPAKARESGVQGKVYATFVVEKDGQLTNIKVIRGIGNGCDEEAIRVLKLSPKWIPGKQNGNVVRQQYTVPISFSLTK